ncbi:uncharacterized protein LOC119730426 [Patiria miniata]|uniref:Macro domain-containing protein n=1 Tax=Patiria miniata TaxID=46514 RepID=A0A914A668_PATMI|nr:uncharacterized protein LOC119730426 [Patiria miniata]
MDGILSDNSDLKVGIKHKDIKIKKPALEDSTQNLAPEPLGVVYKLRDINKELVEAWTKEFDGYERVNISEGDIFKNAPAADAIVSPANSFGFMDGGIDMALSRHFGWQLMNRLQEMIMTEKNGELLVGDALIVPTCQQFWGKSDRNSCWGAYNQGTPIKFLISAPTMRVPEDVSNSINSYLAFRAIILSVQKHNSKPDAIPIRSVLCSGLATSVGCMPPKKCAKQMKNAYDIYEEQKRDDLRNPDSLGIVWDHHRFMQSSKEFGEFVYQEDS